MWIILFVIGSMFPMLKTMFGLHCCLYFFGFMCIFIALYTYYGIPETRGKSYDEIMKLLKE